MIELAAFLVIGLLELVANHIKGIMVSCLAYLGLSWLLGFWPFGSTSTTTSSTTVEATVVTTPSIPIEAVTSEDSGQLLETFFGMFVAGSLGFFLLLAIVTIVISILQERDAPYLGSSSAVFVVGTLIICMANPVLLTVLSGNPLWLLLCIVGFVAIGLWWTVFPRWDLHRWRWRNIGSRLVYVFNSGRGHVTDSIVNHRVPHHEASIFKTAVSAHARMAGFSNGEPSFKDPGAMQRLISHGMFWPFSMLALLFRQLFALLAEYLLEKNRRSYESITKEEAAKQAARYGGSLKPTSSRSLGIGLMALLAVTLTSCSRNNAHQEPSSQPSVSKSIADKAVDKVAERAKGFLREKLEGQKPSESPQDVNATPSVDADPNSESPSESPQQSPTSKVQETNNPPEAPSDRLSRAKAFFGFFKFPALGSWLIILAAWVLAALFAGDDRAPKPYKSGFVIVFASLLLMASNGWYEDSIGKCLGIFAVVSVGLTAIGMLMFAPYMFKRYVRQWNEAQDELARQYIRRKNLVGHNVTQIESDADKAALGKEWQETAPRLGFPVIPPDMRAMPTQILTWAIFWPFIGTRMLIEDYVLNLWQTMINGFRESFERRQAEDRAYLNSLIEEQSQPPTADPTPSPAAVQ